MTSLFIRHLYDNSVFDPRVLEHCSSNDRGLDECTKIVSMIMIDTPLQQEETDSLAVSYIIYFEVTRWMA